jgi:NAD(P)-dependent dehydrogenase (short-subunit alcohol dehydrogenase family)
MPVAIVIGGARRIGAAICKGLATDGYDIGLSYNTSVSEAEATVHALKTAGRKAIATQCDVTQADSIRGALQTLTNPLTYPDLVVYNVGVFPPAKHPRQLTEQELLEAFTIHVVGLFTVAQWYASTCERAQRTGRIVVLGSLGAREIWKDRAAYNTTKAAQATLAASLARSLAPSISINIVAPGAISQPDEPQKSDQSLIDPMRIPKLRHGHPDDVVDAVRYFSRCSDYITGQTIVVDGGYGLVR